MKIFECDLKASYLGLASDTSSQAVDKLGQTIWKSNKEWQSYGAESEVFLCEIWPSSVTLILKFWTWDLHATHHLMQVNICAKLFWNLRRNGRVMEHKRKSLNVTFDLRVWPWPCSYGPGSCAWHIISCWWTFVPGYLKICKGMTELWCGSENLWMWHLTFECDLDLEVSDLRLTCDTSSHAGKRLCQTIWKSKKEWQSHGAETKIFECDLWPSSVTLTLKLLTWVLRVTHHLMLVNICARLFENK